MTTIERIYSHNIKFEYFTRSKRAIPNEAEIQHVKECLEENYLEGELCLAIVNHKRNDLDEFRGWWSIIN